MNRRPISAVAWLLLALGGCAGAASNSSAGGQNTSPQASGGQPGIDLGKFDGGLPVMTDANAPAYGGAMGTGGMASTGGSNAAATGGAPGQGGAAAGGGTSGSVDAARPVDAPPPTCTVNITPSSAPSLVGRPAGDTLTVKGTIVWGVTTPTAPIWKWTVRSPDGTPLTVTQGTSADTIQFPLVVPGSYDITVFVTSTCKGEAWATAIKPQELSQSFLIRVLPPPAAAGSGQTCDSSQNRWCPSEDAVPYEDSSFVLQAGQSRQDDVQFQHGFAVSIDPVIAAQTNAAGLPAVALPSLVRVSPQGSTWTIDGASSDEGPMRALLNPRLSYDVLVVPLNATSTSTYPPLLVSKPAQEFRATDFDVAAGVTVRGTLRTPTGSASGARVLLRANANAPTTLPLPSTVGSADATGAYSLRASAGTVFSAVVVPPSDTSLPQITIADCIDLTQSTNGTNVDRVDFTWNTVSTTTMTLQVLTSDNITPAANTTVRLQSQDGALPDAGVLSVAGTDWSGTVAGSVQQQGTTDADGSIVFANIPKVAYNLTLMPPINQTGDDAITSGSIDLSGAGASIPRSLTLGRKINLSGRLLPADAASGAHLVATDTGADVLVSIISTPVGSDGSYAFSADPGRTYRFSVEPAAGKKLPTRIPLYGVKTTDQDTKLADRTLPSGLKVNGVVSFSGRQVGGAIVQAYCERAAMAGCADPNNPSASLPPPLVEFATLADGSYSFYLPDPQSGD